MMEIDPEQRSESEDLSLQSSVKLKHETPPVSQWKDRVLVFIGLSLLLHAGFSITLKLLPENTSNPQTITVELVEPKNPEQNNLEEPVGILVQQNEKALNQEIPEKTKYFSANNQSVAKETAAVENGEFRNRKDAKTGVQRPDPTPVQHQKKKNSQSGEKKSQVHKMDLNPQFDALAAMERSQFKEEKYKKEIQDKFLQGEDPLPSSSGSEASRTSDYLKDVDRGLETLLNTKEAKYYTYFNRIRSQLLQHWNGKLDVAFKKIHREGRSIASVDHVTKLLFHLNSNGELVKVQYLTRSGVTDLDDAALEAFKAAAPFPNPPEGLVDNDGTAKIYWNFVVES